MTMRVFLVAAFLALFPSAAQAFLACHPPKTIRSIAIPQRLSVTVPLQFQSCTTPTTITTPSSLQSQIDDDDSTSPIETPAGPSRRIAPPKTPLIPKNILINVAKMYNALMISLGSFAFCSLVLNACGYDYRFEDTGVRIDTVQQLRAEKQFDMAYNHLSASESQPPTSLPE